jgi:hypothetical protein
LYVHEFGFGFERAETQLVVGVDNHRTTFKDGTKGSKEDHTFFAIIRI